MTAATQHLVLVGGGHSHALFLRHWAEQPLPNVNITLISPQRYTPYSGMLPGLIAGHYQFHETHIDLQSVCLKAGAKLLLQSVVSIDTSRKCLVTDNHESVSFDVLSINTGITPALPQSLVGNVIPVKPIAEFFPRWQSEINTLQQLPVSETRNYAVVGGGAAGVELVLAMQHRLSQPDVAAKVSLTLLFRGDNPLEGYSTSVRNKMVKLLNRSGIRLSPGTDVTAEYLAHQGFDSVFWCTQAQAAGWLRQTDLQLSEHGFVAVNSHLQSLSCPDVFAAGDAADFVEKTLPKAGVYAVRQAATLGFNIRARLLQQVMQPYRPQHSFLSLLACGGQTAIAARVNGWLPAFYGRWVWLWKNYIDRKFMEQF